MTKVRLIDADALKEVLELSKYIIPNDLNRLLNSEINRCIEAIDNAPTVEPCYQTTSCLDCDNYDKENHNCPRYCEVIRDAIKSRPQGEWIVKSNGTTNYYACDKCGRAGDIQDKFCRECGADMRPEEEDES